MAFGRSNSLSINTSGSLFGNNNTSQGQQSAGPFGSSATNASQPQTASGLFGSTSQPQTGGLFGGSTTAQASQPPQSAGLFGQAPASSAPQSGGLFGALNKPAAASSTTGGTLFGGAALGASSGPQSQAQNVAAPQSGGLFSLGQPAQQNQQKSSSLFGGAPTQQTSTTPSLFGNTNTAQNQPSLFGASQQTQPQQQNTMFGGLGQSSQNKPFGATLSGIQQPVQTQLDAVKGTTRFVDLHPDFQATVELIDTQIQKHISNCDLIRESLPQTAAAVDSVAPDVAYIEQFMATTQLGNENDAAATSQQMRVVVKDVDDLKLSIRAINNLRLPSQFHYGNRINLSASAPKPSASSPSALDAADDPMQPVDLLSYFSRRTQDLGATLDLYQRQIREIEAHLRTMEAGTVEKAQQLMGSRNGVRDQRRELVEALKAIEGAILEAAKRVGETRDLVTKETLGSVGAALL